MNSDGGEKRPGETRGTADGDRAECGEVRARAALLAGPWCARAASAEASSSCNAQGCGSWH
jgi:hypothetical protein